MQDDIHTELSDMNGKILVRKSFSVNSEATYEIPLSDLMISEGMYLLKLSQGDSFRTVKVIKQ